MIALTLLAIMNTSATGVHITPVLPIGATRQYSALTEKNKPPPRHHRFLLNNEQELDCAKLPQGSGTMYLIITKKDNGIMYMYSV